MRVIEAYDLLRRHGYVRDQFEFDRKWLGRKPGYTAYIRSTSRSPSIGTLFKFYLKLLERGDREFQLGVDGRNLHDMAEDIFMDMCERAIR